MIKKSFILFALFTLPSAAQEQDPGLTPREKMTALDYMLGTWSQTLHYSPDQGDTWQTLPPKTVTASKIMKDMAIEQKPVDLEAKGFNLLDHFTYDQYRNVYRLSIIDDTWGLMDLYEGTLVDDKLIVTNVKSGTTFPTESGGQRFFKLIFAGTAQARSLVIDSSEDGGQNWHPNFKVEFTKTGP